MTNFRRRFLTTISAALMIAFAASLAFAHTESLPAPPSQVVHAFLGFGGDQGPQAEALPDTYEIHDDATFTKRTKSYSMMPYNKADLEFELYLPADWKPEDVALGNGQSDMRITGTVADFTSPMIGTQQANASIDVLKLEYEFSARNWLKNYVTASGYLPQGNVTEINNRSATCSYIRAVEGSTTSTFGYISVRVTGSYVVTARFETPLNLKAYTAFLQKKSIDSFKLLYPKEEPVEEQKVFTLVDALKFTYPSSWSVVNPDFRDMNRLSVQLQNLKPATEHAKIVQGYIWFQAIRRMRSTDLLTELDTMRKYFADTMQVDFKKMLSTGKSDAYERFLFNRYEVYDVVGKKVKNPTTQEIHLVVLGDKEWYIFIFLYTPKELNDLPNWGRNVQSFRQIIKSLK